MEPEEQQPTDQVRLIDLEVIKRYSLAVRQEWVPAEELLAVLDATREEVAAAIQPPARSRSRSRARRGAGRDGSA